MQLVKNMEIEIRKPTIEDANDIIKVNIETWRTTYRGIVSDDFLDSLSSDKPRLEKTLERIRDNNPYLIALN